MVIKGKVLGTDGEPIIGASVLVKGSTTGVVTDLDGNYTLSNVSKGAILEFSYVGYVKLTKTVGNETMQFCMRTLRCWRELRLWLLAHRKRRVLLVLFQP